MPRALLALVGALALALPLLPAPVAAQGDGTWKPTKATKVLEGLDMPVDLAFSKDGKSAYYVELLRGNLRRVDVATGALDPKVVYRVPNYNTGVERGVFGLAVDPDLPDGRGFYLSYSKNATGGGTVNVLSRLVDGKETVLFERPGNIMHNGGRVLVVDDHLFLTTGDTVPITEWTYEKSMATAQSTDAMAGKALRLTRDGKPAPGNPWGNAAWDMGHRNVYGIAYDPATGRLFVTENGSEKEDEINLVEAGANYGWPVCAGPCSPPDPRYRDPIVHYPATVGPTGATIFRGDLWFAEFNHGNLHRIHESSPGKWTDDIAYHYTGNSPRVLDVETHPDGQSVWFVTWQELWRLDFDPDPRYPPTTPTGPTGPTGPTTPTGPQFGTPPTDGAQGSRWPIPGASPALAALAALGAAVALALVGGRRAR